MTTWWESQSSFEQIFWYIAVPFSVILIIQLILTFAGMGGGDSDIGVGETDITGVDLDAEINLSSQTETGDASHITDLDPSFNFFTVRNFIAFFTMFGWTGIAALDGGLSKTWTIVLAFAAGLLTMVVVSVLFYYISKLQDAGGTIRITNALNQIGNVYIPIKASGGNVGKIQITIQDSLREMPAITRENNDLPTGTVVRVTGIVSNSILVVQKI